MRIAVMGTGGVGGYFGARLAAAGEDVTFIARGAQLDALRDKGIAIESALGSLLLPTVHATDDPSQVSPPDIVLFCVKLWDVEAAARQIEPMVGSATAVLALQNGVDAESELAAILGQERVIGGVAHISALVVEPGVIRHTGKLQRLTFGELNGKPSDRTKNFLEACQRAKLDARLTDRIDEAIWDKFIFLIAFSGMTSLTRTGIGPIRDDPECYGMFRAAMAEAFAVAKAKGIDFSYDPLAQWDKAIAAMPHDYRSSMLADLERGRRLELPWLSGTVARLGKQLGVETPVNRFIAAILNVHANPGAKPGTNPAKNS